MAFFTKVYSQKGAVLNVKGLPISGFMDGSSIKVTWDGGEVEKTEGTDGAGLNLATHQGATISFTLRETSSDNSVLRGIFEAQQYAGVFGDVTVVPCALITGGGVAVAMANCLIGPPGELSTGDKKQGGIEWKVIGTNAI
jgi:hypothetical protein